MTAGRIVVDRVSRTFRVHAQAQRTLKDVFVARGRMRTREVVALDDVSLRVEPGEALGLVGRNGSGKSTLLRIVSGIIKPTSGRMETTGRIASLLELGAGFHPDFTGRENVYLNGSIHGLSRARVREAMDEIVAFSELEQFIDLPVRTYSSGMYMRLGFAVAAHIQADVLLLDEVFAVGDEQFQRKCFGKIAEFKQRGGTIVFVSHDAQAVERLCDRAVLLRQGRVEFDGETVEAIGAYRRLLAADANPEELEAGLREWGTGEARIVEQQLLDGDGDERTAFSPGEPLVVRLRVAAQPGLAPPRVSLELRDEGGLVLGSASAETRDLGWGADGGEFELRYRIERLPLADGRFHLRLALLDGEHGRLLHTLDDALRFLVYPSADTTGAILLDGTWAMQEIGSGAPIRRG
ncbi:MAG TPA: ABC transporter ATP-binding protein [Gaiellaceae bacterium]|jgi:ABC-type polysaccharide/polyol phosphate transport system ATPase subunit|nr:ABC transporter ATP-binding protein [Gaiellaceae bacterium]